MGAFSFEEVLRQAFDRGLGKIHCKVLKRCSLVLLVIHINSHRTGQKKKNNEF